MRDAARMTGSTRVFSSSASSGMGAAGTGATTGLRMGAEADTIGGLTAPSPSALGFATGASGAVCLAAALGAAGAAVPSLARAGVDAACEGWALDTDGAACANGP